MQNVDVQHESKIITDHIPRGLFEVVKFNQWKFHNALTFLRLITVYAHEKQIALCFGMFFSNEFSLNVFIEFAEFSDKNIFHYSKRALTCHTATSCVKDQDATTVPAGHI